MNQQPQRIYEFGPFRLDAVEHLLLRDGEAVPLTPKAFDLLLALVERHGRLLEKDELLKLVWPDTFVEEANLSSNISLIRKSLGDRENGQKFIETVPRRGYRFVARVREIVEESVEITWKEQPKSLKAVEEQQPTLANGATATAPVTPAGALIIWLRRHKRGAVISLAILIVAAATVATFTWEGFRRKRGWAINSIAVLPFANADPNTEHLSDGITESLINSLSQLSQLKVIARTTAFRYKGKDADPRTVGQDLKIDAVLTGRVTQQGETFLVQVDLVSAVDGAQLWGERYNRKLSDIFTMQEEIARQISERLRVGLSGEERKLITKRYTDNFEAYQHYLKGRQYAEIRTEEAYQKAIEHYNQALKLDPNYALAYVGLADAYYKGLWPPPEEKISRSRAAAMKAIKIDETLGEAHTSLARMLWQYDWNWIEGESEFKRALDLDPGSAFAHRIYSYYLTAIGRHHEAVAAIRRAQQLDPLSPIINRDLGTALYFAGETDQALEQCRKTQEMFPDFAETYIILGWALAKKGACAEAIAELNNLIPHAGIYATELKSSLGYNYALCGKRDEAIKILDGLKKQRSSSYDIAIIYTGLGKKDQAFEWLQRAYENRHYALVYLKVHPLFESLRTDSRFVVLLRNIGAPP